MKLQSLWPVPVAYFTAANHYTLFTISQPIFNQQETANCSHESQSELLLQVKFPQMPSQAQVLHNPAETRGFILRMNLNKWIKFHRLWQIPAIWHHWVQDGLPSHGSSNTRAGSCLCCLCLVNRAAAMAGCDRCGTFWSLSVWWSGCPGHSCHCCLGHCWHCWHSWHSCPTPLQSLDSCAAVSGREGQHLLSSMPKGWLYSSLC